MAVLRGGMQRTTRAHAMAFEGSRVRGFGGSGFDSRASPRKDHRPSGSGDEQVLVTRSIHVKKGAAGNRAQVDTFLLASSQQPSTVIADTASEHSTSSECRPKLISMQKGRLRSKGQAMTT